MNTANTLSSNKKRTDITTSMFHLGCGSSRSVYALKKERVVKYTVFGNRRTGIAQNKAEYRIYKNAKKELNILCPIIDISKKRDVIVMQKAIAVDSEIIPLKLQNKFDNFRRKITMLHKFLWSVKDQTKFKSKRDIKKHIKERHDLSKEEESMLKSDFFSQICKLIIKYNLLIGDIIRDDSWGYLNNRFVLIDYGCTVDVYDKHY